LSVAFVAPQDVIEETGLPKLICLQSGRDRPFQTSNPTDKDKVVAAADKEMNVVRHDDVSADGDTVFGESPCCVLIDRLMCLSQGGQVFAVSLANVTK
jgi:hypothetical protein